MFIRREHTCCLMDKEDVKHIKAILYNIQRVICKREEKLCSQIAQKAFSEIKAKCLINSKFAYQRA